MAHKICLEYNNTQAIYFARAAGTARFAYNWALTAYKSQYQAHLPDLSRRFHTIGIRVKPASVKQKVSFSCLSRDEQA